MRLAGAIAVLTAIVVVAGTASASAPVRTLSVAGRIAAISADGGRIAVDVAATRSGRICDRIAVWTPPGSRTTAIAAPYCRSTQDTDTPVDSLTLAGARLAWVSYSYGNHAYCDGPFTATLASRSATNLKSPDCDGTSGDVYWDFAGNGPLLVAREYQQCAADCAPDYNDTYQTDVTLFSVGSRLSAIGPLRRNAQLEDVNAGRMLLGQGTKLEVVRQHHGSQALYITLPAGFTTTPDVQHFTTQGLLAGNDVVAVSGATVAAYDATTGAARPTRRLRSPVGNGTSVRGLDSGILLYNVRTAIHLLRLRDGRDVTVATVPGLVDEQLTPNGLFYAYNAPGGGATAGRVAFLAHAAVVRALR